MVDERVPGRERLTVKFLRGPALTQGEFGDPVTAGGTVYDVCIYDAAGVRVSAVTVDRAGDDCSGKACWKALGTRGYKYKDTALTADGVKLMQMKGGAAGQSKAFVKGKGANLPAGVAAGLQESASATVQLFVRDAPKCLSVGLDDVKLADGFRYKALLK